MTRIRMGLVPGLLLALALAVAACDGGKTSGVASRGGTANANSSQDERQAALAFARCMRQHGISNMPDPQINGDDIVQQLPTRAEQNSPKFTAAQEACRQYRPNGGQASPLPAQERQQALAFARCMRQHGISNMPDPRFTANGIDQPLPARVNQNDPRLKAAEQACHQYGSLGPPKPGGPPNSGGAK